MSARASAPSALSTAHSSPRRIAGAPKRTLIRASARRSSERSPGADVASIALAAMMTLAGSPAVAFDGDAAGAFSSRGCVGCHAAGGNVVNGSATLFAKDLERNGLISKEDVAKVIELGRGKMPGYGEACAPRGACTFGARLDASEIDALATYVLERAANEWK